MAEILFIDDDENIRFLVREELSLEGHAVRVAHDGLEGLRAVEERLPDLVILDVMMPGLGGLEVLGRLKKAHPNLPVFLFTAYGDHGERGRQLGADDYFVKSADLSPVKCAIRRVAAEKQRMSTRDG
jgi:DNA-binding response OmpR family regulator